MLKKKRKKVHNVEITLGNPLTKRENTCKIDYSGLSSNSLKGRETNQTKKKSRDCPHISNVQ